MSKLFVEFVHIKFKCRLVVILIVQLHMCHARLRKNFDLIKFVVFKLQSVKTESAVTRSPCMTKFRRNTIATAA